MNIIQEYITTKLIYGLWFHIKDWKFDGLKIYNSHKYFLNLVFPQYLEFKSRVRFKTGIKTLHTHNEFNIQAENDYNIMEKYFNNENFLLDGMCTIREVCQKELEKFIKACVDGYAEYKGDTLEELRSILNALLSYYDGDSKKVLHSKEGCNKLLEEIAKLSFFGKDDRHYNKRITEWANYLYYYLFFAVTNNLHSELAFSNYPLHKDLEEYNDKITLMYGTSGNPGMYQLYSLAETKNIIALFECGEHEYYGTGPSRKVSYEKAYEYYCRTLECNKEHPLALWSIAYMQFEYLFQKHITEEHKVTEIEKLQKKGGSAIYNSIMEKVGKAYLYDGSAKAAAANLLGKIMECSEDVFPRVFKETFEKKIARDYYKESAELGYVYGCNNYVKILMGEIHSLTNLTDKVEKGHEVERYLKRSALSGEPWASNKYGVYLYNGWRLENVVIIKQNHQDAYKRFEYSMKMMKTQSYYWPLINMCKCFWLNSESGRKKKIREDIEVIINLINIALSDLKDVAQTVELVVLKKQALEFLEPDYFFSKTDKWNVYQTCKEKPNIDCIFSKADYQNKVMKYKFVEPMILKEEIKNEINEIIFQNGITPVCSISYGDKKNETFLYWDIDKNENEDPIFDLASITKFFLALIYVKVEEMQYEFDGKKMVLENRVGDYSKELFPKLNEIRICDLLSFNVELKTEDRIDAFDQYDEAFLELRKIQGEYSKVQIYSDMPMMVLAELLFIITGRKFHEWIDMYLIEPLQLRNTFWNFNKKLAPRCISYENEMRLKKNGTIVIKENKQGFVNDSKALIMSNNYKNLCGNAGLFSSAYDMSKIMKALLNEQIVSKKALFKIVIAGGWDKEADNNSFGFGCYRKYCVETQSEVPFILSPYTIAMAGFTGSYFSLDLLNEVYFFIGANRLSNCVVENKSEYIEEDGIIRIDGKEYKSSLNFPYKRDQLRNQVAKAALIQKYYTTTPQNN